MKILKYIVVALGIVMLALAVYLIFYYFNKSKALPINNNISPTGQIAEPSIDSAENAENLEFIKNALKEEGIGPSWISSNCIYAVTTTKEDFQSIDIREDHTSEGCRIGDPNVSPRIESFRLKDGVVEWFDSLPGNYAPLDAYRQYLNSLPK